MKQTAVDRLYPEQLTELMHLAAPKPKGGDVQEPQVQYVKRNTIMVAFEKNELRTACRGCGRLRGAPSPRN
ncbi:MAG: hypothetical protein IPI41_03135 [Flavobacteriales bacterium]|nr:hypothetical protein [Flavobacteriales bacterium]